MSVVRRFPLLVAAVGLLAFTGLASAAATDPQFDPVPVDSAWAGSIVLTTTDVGPGWTAQSDPGGSGSDESTFCPEATADYSDLVVTGGADSEFTRGVSDVSSSALVWKTAEQAQAAWDRTNATLPVIDDCIVALFATLSSKQLKIVVTANGPMPFPAVAPRTAAYRIKLLFKTTKRVKGKLKKISSPASIDAVLLGTGRTMALVFLNAFNRKPFTPAYEQSLAAAMAARMAADPTATPVP